MNELRANKMKVGAKPGKVTAWCLVRDSQGRPKFDDIFNIPQPLWDSLTPEDKRYIENERNASNNCS